jgi:acetyl-CoA acetyltransferase
MGIAPVPAMHKALGRAGWRLDEVGLLEVNEATFAAQSVAVVDELKADPALVNVNGGAIAIGHPLGCSGAPIVTTLLHEMRRRGTARGAATLERRRGTARSRHVGASIRLYAARCGIVPVALRAGGRLGSGCAVILGPAVPRWRQ